MHLAGVCSTDLEMVRGYYPFEGIPGHEFIGLVADDNGHPGLRGNRVVGVINISCGTCERCLCGGPSQCVCMTRLGIFKYKGDFAAYSIRAAKNLLTVQG